MEPLSSKDSLVVRVEGAALAGDARACKLGAGGTQVSEKCGQGGSLPAEAAGGTALAEGARACKVWGNCEVTRAHNQKGKIARPCR